MKISVLARKLFARNPQDQDCFVVISAFRPEGVTEQESFALRDIFNSSGSVGWWFINPGTFLAFFHTLNSLEAATLANALRAFRLSDASSLGVGTSTGKLICELLPNGRLAGLPLGSAVSQSLAVARSDSEQSNLQATEFNRH